MAKKQVECFWVISGCTSVSQEWGGLVSNWNAMSKSISLLVSSGNS